MRLSKLVAFAKEHSPYYQSRYREFEAPIFDLHTLPPVTKPELMANFDDWVTDRSVTQAGVEAFLADKTSVGSLYLDRFAVWTTSGTTGMPGIFVQDGHAQKVYNSLVFLRGYGNWLNLGLLHAITKQRFRCAFILATGGHFAGISIWETVRRNAGWLSDQLRTLSVLSPLPELVRQLNDFQPAILFSYPSALSLLAGEQRAGRLEIHPVLITTTGEWLDPSARDGIAASFQCRVHEFYGASEFPFIAISCDQGWLHVNADWLVLEPVDNHYHPVSPGQTSKTVLLTNLANRIQPIIRYDLGDSITACPKPCPCGNLFPAIRVQGRRDEILSFHTPDGETIHLLPMALTAQLETIPGLQRFQVIQTSPSALCVRIEETAGSEGGQVWEIVACRLQDYLANQGLAFVTIQKAVEPPQAEPASGKFRQVWAVLIIGS